MYLLTLYTISLKSAVHFLTLPQQFSHRSSIFKRNVYFFRGWLRSAVDGSLLFPSPLFSSIYPFLLFFLLFFSFFLCFINCFLCSLFGFFFHFFGFLRFLCLFSWFPLVSFVFLRDILSLFLFGCPYSLCFTSNFFFLSWFLQFFFNSFRPSIFQVSLGFLCSFICFMVSLVFLSLFI